MQEELAARGAIERRAAVTSIAWEFDRLTPIPRGASPGCAGDDGARLFAIFHYPAEPPVAVEVALDSCASGEARGRPRVAIPTDLAKRLRRLTSARS